MIKNILQRAFALKSKKHYKHALEIFYKALEIDNSSIELLVEIAELYYLINNKERTLSYIEQILEINPMHCKTLKLLQKIFEDNNAYDEAERTAKNIYCISQDINDLVEIFRLLNLQHKYDEIFTFNIPIYTLNIYLEQARALYQSQKLEQAENLLEEAINKNFINQDILFLYAQTLFYINKKDVCIKIAAQLNIDTTNAELMFFFSQLELYKQNLDKAIDYLNLAIRKNNSNSTYYHLLGNIYYKKGDNNLAQKNYNIAISLDSTNPTYHFALANVYYTQKQYKKALKELMSDLFEAKLLKAIILYDTGYLALAKKELLNLEKEQPQNHIIKEYKSKISEELKIIKKTL